MSESVARTKEVILDYFDLVVQIGEQWITKFQSDPNLQNILLAFLIGSTFGWFLRSLFSPGQAKKASQSGSGADVLRARSGKTKEEVELDARRRL